MTELYYHYFSADSVLGPVGKGPFDFDLTPFEKETVTIPGHPGHQNEARLPDGVELVSIPVKNRIRKFALHCSYGKNFLVFDEELLEHLTPSVQNLKQANLKFASGEKIYFTGNLIHRYAFATITDFPGCAFDVYKHSQFHINGTQICRGEVPYGEGFVKLEEGVTVLDEAEYREIRKAHMMKLCILHPQKLRLKSNEVLPVFHFETTMTFFHESVVERLRRYQNSGAWFPGPPVQIDYI